MKLSIGDRIKGSDSIYKVVAIIFATVYLRTIKDNDMNYLCEIEDVYHNYLDVEII